MRIPEHELRVVAVNHFLLYRDFPWLFRLTDDELNLWLRQHMGWMRLSQFNSDNTEADDHRSADLQMAVTERVWERVNDREKGRAYNVSDQPKTIALVPKHYGRAMLVDVSNRGREGSPPGCVDLKGSGAAKPALGYHNNGLLPLGSALGEFFKTTAVEAALASELMDTVCPLVGQYAVLALDNWTIPSMDNYINESDSSNEEKLEYLQI